MHRFRFVITICFLFNVIACAKAPSAALPAAAPNAAPTETSPGATGHADQDAQEASAKIEALAATTSVHTQSSPVREDPVAASRPIVVLVPGFFNSITPSHYSKDGWVSYWSAAVINTISKRGFTVLMADMLAPIGTIEQNGEMLSRFLAATSDRFKDRKIILIAHSAGGLYAMYALSQRPTLPVSTVITIATPYEGVEFVENLAANVPGVDELAQYLKLDGVRGFRRDLVKKAIENLNVPDGVRWIAVGGTQEPCFMLTCTDSHYLSWVLSIAQRLMSEASDGIVTLSSALGLHTQLRHADGRRVPMERWADFSFDLEHWKMVEEADLFRLLGVVDIPRIRSEQRRYFNEIMDRLMKDPAGPGSEIPH